MTHATPPAIIAQAKTHGSFVRILDGDRIFTLDQVDRATKTCLTAWHEGRLIRIIFDTPDHPSSYRKMSLEGSIAHCIHAEILEPDDE